MELQLLLVVGLCGIAARIFGDRRGLTGVAEHQRELAIDALVLRRELPDDERVQLLALRRRQAVLDFRRRVHERAVEPQLVLGREVRLLQHRELLVEHRLQALAVRGPDPREHAFERAERVGLREHAILPLGARGVLERDAAGPADEPIRDRSSSA